MPNEKRLNLPTRVGFECGICCSNDTLIEMVHCGDCKDPKLGRVGIRHYQAMFFNAAGWPSKRAWATPMSHLLSERWTVAAHIGLPKLQMSLNSNRGCNSVINQT